jgi:hypothetical protein
MMRGPNPDEMQEPAGNTVVRTVVAADDDRDWAFAEKEINIAPIVTATPRMISPLAARSTRNSIFYGNEAAFRSALA